MWDVDGADLSSPNSCNVITSDWSTHAKLVIRSFKASNPRARIGPFMFTNELPDESDWNCSLALMGASTGAPLAFGHSTRNG